MLRDVRHAVRALRSWRLGAMAAVLTLAVGIGTSTSMYAFLGATLDILPNIDDVQSLARVYASNRGAGIQREQLTTRDVRALSAVTSFESIAAYAPLEGADVHLGTGAVDANVSSVTKDFFAALRTRAERGRLFSEIETAGGGAPVAVISDAFWRRHFASHTVGDATIVIDRVPRTIVGVLPRDFGYPFIGISGDVWVPFSTHNDLGQQRVSTIARLKPGATWTAAQSELAATARANGAAASWSWSAVPVEDDVRLRARGGTMLVFGPALVVLLIGCTNVACMLLARGVDREIELSVRGALGASRAKITRQLVAEHAVLGIAGGTTGWMFAGAILRWLASQMAQFQPEFAARLPPTPALLPAAIAFSVGACIAFGAVPALRLSRRNTTAALKSGAARQSARFVGYHARDLVVFFEVAFAVGLIVTTAMWVKLFRELQLATPLFAAGRILAVDVPATDTAAVLDHAASIAGIEAVSMGTGLPGGRASAQLRTDEGRTARANTIGAEANYFATLGVPILRGRSFDRTERSGSSRVVVLSDSAARMLWPEGDPLGARVTIAGAGAPVEAVVIGICGDALNIGALLRAGIAAPDVYVPFDASVSKRAIVIARAGVDARTLIAPLAAATHVRAADRSPVPRVLGSDSAFVHHDSMFVVRLFGGFALVALLLAASGIYGVISQSVAQRTTEFGVRMALGASATQVLWMVLRREGKLIAAAIVAGTTVTLAITRSAFAELLAISAPDPRVWAGVMFLCGGLAAVAMALATWRIVRLDPSAVLRNVEC